MTMMNPPMYPDAPVSAQRSTWPTVIGVIAIVLGSGGLLCGCLSAVFTATLDQMMSFIPQNQPGMFDRLQEIQFDVIKEYLVMNVAVSLIGALLGVMLLIGGIMLIRRNPSSVGVLRIWSIFKFIYAFAGAAVTYLVGTKTAERVGAEMTQSDAAGIMIMTFVEIGVSFVITIALPIFLLIWFARSRIRAEAASWRVRSDQHWPAEQPSQWPPAQN